MHLAVVKLPGVIRGPAGVVPGGCGPDLLVASVGSGGRCYRIAQVDRGGPRLDQPDRDTLMNGVEDSSGQVEMAGTGGGAQYQPSYRVALASADRTRVERGPAHLTFLLRGPRRPVRASHMPSTMETVTRRVRPVPADAGQAAQEERQTSRGPGDAGGVTEPVSRPGSDGQQPLVLRRAQVRSPQRLVVELVPPRQRPPSPSRPCRCARLRYSTRGPRSETRSQWFDTIDIIYTADHRPMVSLVDLF